MAVALITGAAGFCGRHLIRRLRRETGIKIYGVDIKDECPEGLALEGYISADLLDDSLASNIIGEISPDLVFHLVGTKQGSPSDINDINLSCGIRLLEAIRDRLPRARTLVVGSAAEYGHQLPEAMPLTEDRQCNPTGPYALSKYALTSIALDFVRQYGLKVVVVRPFNIIGSGVPSDLVVGAFLGRIKTAMRVDGEAEIRVGNLDDERDFVDVDDVVDAYVRIMQRELWGEIFNICSGRPIAIGWIVEALLANSDRPIRVRQDPSLMRNSEVKAIYGSCQKASKAFGFKPNLDFKEVLHKAWLYELGGK
ncbi:MAG: NAD-dependent epimerase/dehydratase family protein [Deltaproteobacteria bacterium]|nr:NAD-dependent epimerase/dehydratase family protein [Deltaproteobacteria bacterium]